MAPGAPQLEVINSINVTQLPFLASAVSVLLSIKQLSLFPLFQTLERQHLIGSVDDHCLLVACVVSGHVIGY